MYVDDSKHSSAVSRGRKTEGPRRTTDNLTARAFKQKETKAVKRNCMSGPLLIFSLSVAQKPKSHLGRLTDEIRNLHTETGAQ
jgi:hypothetical protein